MTKSSATSKKVNPAEESFTALVIDAIQDIKGKHIVQIDLRKIADAPAWYFIICEGESSTQIRAIASNVVRRAREEMGIRANHSEGQQSARWVVVDFFDVVLHVFDKATRHYYDLENLWEDGHFTEFQNI